MKFHLDVSYKRGKFINTESNICKNSLIQDLDLTLGNRRNGSLTAEAGLMMWLLIALHLKNDRWNRNISAEDLNVGTMFWYKYSKCTTVCRLWNFSKHMNTHSSNTSLKRCDWFGIFMLIWCFWVREGLTEGNTKTQNSEWENCESSESRVYSV